MPIAPWLELWPTGEHFEDHDADFFVIGEDGLIKEIRAYGNTSVFP